MIAVRCFAILLALTAIARGDTITLTVDAPGHGPTEIESAVAPAMSKAFHRLAALQRIETQCLEGQCRGLLVFSSSGDPFARLQAAGDKVNSFSAKLPNDYRPGRLRYGNPESLATIWLTVTAKPTDLANVTRNLLADRLAMKPGVTDVQIDGLKTSAKPAIFIIPHRLAAHGLTIEDVDKALADADPADLAKTIVGKTRIPVRLSDVATIVAVTPPPSDITFNERRATTIAIHANRKANVEDLRKAIADLTKSLPPGASVSVVADLSKEKYVYAQATPAAGSSDATWNRAKDGLRRVIAMRPENTSRLAFADPFTGEFHCLIESTDTAATRKSLAGISSAKIRTNIVGLDRGRIPFPARIALTGPDRAALQQWAKAVASALAMDAILTEIEAESVDLQPRDELKTDAAALSRLGLREDDVEKSLTLLSGGSVTGPRAVLSLIAAGPLTDRLKQLKVRDRSGNLIEMSAFVSVETKKEPRSLRTVNAQPAVRIIASPGEGHSPADAVQKMIEIAQTTAAPGDDYRIVDDTIPVP